MFSSITYGTFIFFGSMTVVGAVYAYLVLPETKGVALEDMDVLFSAKGLAKQKMRKFQEYRRDDSEIEGKTSPVGEKL